MPGSDGSFLCFFAEIKTKSNLKTVFKSGNSVLEGFLAERDPTKHISFERYNRAVRRLID